jgi:hypothetical protein
MQMHWHVPKPGIFESQKSTAPPVPWWLSTEKQRSDNNCENRPQSLLATANQYNAAHLQDILIHSPGSMPV